MHSECFGWLTYGVLPLISYALFSLISAPPPAIASQASGRSGNKSDDPAFDRTSPPAPARPALVAAAQEAARPAENQAPARNIPESSIQVVSATTVDDTGAEQEHLMLKMPTRDSKIVLYWLLDESGD